MTCPSDKGSISHCVHDCVWWHVGLCLCKYQASSKARYQADFEAKDPPQAAWNFAPQSRTKCFSIYKFAGTGSLNTGEYSLQDD